MKQKSEWKYFYTSVAGGWVPLKWKSVQPLDPTPPLQNSEPENFGLRNLGLGSKPDWMPVFGLTLTNVSVGLSCISWRLPWVSMQIRL